MSELDLVRVRALFDALHGLAAADAAQRATELCDDPQVVEEALALHARDAALRAAPPALGAGTALVPILPGQQLGRFKLLEPTSAGATADVWRAVTTEGRTVAVKVARQDLEGTARARAEEAFLREVACLAEVAHPALPELLDVQLAPEGAAQPSFLVLPWYEGGPLTPASVAAAGRAPLDVLLDLCDAVGALHGVGWIHGDLKPSNVRLGPAGSLVLLDFGCAARAQQALPATTFGTPEWRAPELAAGAPGSTASDVYALARIAEVLLPGADRGPELQSLLRAAQARSPERRPRDAAELARALREARAAERARARAHARRRVALRSALLLACVGVAVVLWEQRAALRARSGASQLARAVRGDAEALAALPADASGETLLALADAAYVRLVAGDFAAGALLFERALQLAAPALDRARGPLAPPVRSRLAICAAQAGAPWLARARAALGGGAEGDVLAGLELLERDARAAVAQLEAALIRLTPGDPLWSTARRRLAQARAALDPWRSAEDPLVAELADAQMHATQIHATQVPGAEAPADHLAAALARRAASAARGEGALPAPHAAAERTALAATEGARDLETLCLRAALLVELDPEAAVAAALRLAPFGEEQRSAALLASARGTADDEARATRLRELFALAEVAPLRALLEGADAALAAGTADTALLAEVGAALRSRLAAAANGGPPYARELAERAEVAVARALTAAGAVADAREWLTRCASNTLPAAHFLRAQLLSCSTAQAALERQLTAGVDAGTPVDAGNPVGAALRRWCVASSRAELQPSELEGALAVLDATLATARPTHVRAAQALAAVPRRLAGELAETEALIEALFTALADSAAEGHDVEFLSWIAQELVERERDGALERLAPSLATCHGAAAVDLGRVCAAVSSAVSSAESDAGLLAALTALGPVDEVAHRVLVRLAARAERRGGAGAAAPWWSLAERSRRP